MVEGPRGLAVPRIHPPYAGRIVRTSAVLWLLLRLMLVGMSKTILLATEASLVVVGVAVLLCWFDGRRMNEHLFHENLGTPVWLGVGLSLATVLVLEMGTMAVARMVVG